jgi:hypothetical protein
MNESWKTFYGNVSALPVDGKSVFIRPLMNNGTGKYSPSPLIRSGVPFSWDTRLFPISVLLDAFGAGLIQNYDDAIAMPN